MNDKNPAGTPVRHKLQVHFDTHECQVSRDVLAGMADDLDSLARQVGHFPQADVRVLIEWNGRNNEYVVKLTLLLPGETLVTSDHDPVLHAAFARALASLEDAVRGYEERLDGRAERRKQQATGLPEVAPAAPIDLAAIDAAAAAGDYPAFRAAVAPFEEWLRLRVGRWVERYPAVEARIGRGLEVADVTEGVFLAAFEGHAHRPEEVRYREWLESLIDPAIRAIEHDPEGELENINMARAASGTGPTGR
jgi:ribosome-associated translation inhibitor RaiA